MLQLNAQVSRLKICSSPGAHIFAVWIFLAAVLLPNAGWSLELSMTAHGRARYRHIGLSDYQVDAKGTLQGQERWGNALIRLYPEVRVGENFVIKANLQLLDGQFYGEESAHGSDVVLNPWKNKEASDQFMVREAYVQVPVGIGILRAGRMVSHWGLGILANGGDKENYLFADASHGDICNRAMFLTKPAKPFSDSRLGDALTLALGADLVEHDELTDRADGDRAVQYIGALLWKERTLELGFYMANRNLEKDNGDLTKASAFDLFARWERIFSDAINLELTFEGVYIMGTTEQARFEGAQYPLDIRQFGGVLRSRVMHHDYQLGGGLELGLASGDNNTQDGTARAMKLDPGYKVGMILFEEVLSRISARSHDRVTDPDLVGTPAKGTDLIPTNGSVTNTFYLHPHVTWAPLEETLEVQIGYLVALAPADVVDPFSSAEVGGYNHNAFGVANASGLLGTEFNASLRSTLDLDGYFSVGVGLQYGLFQPGDALGSADGVEGLGTIHKVRLLTDLNW